MSKKRHYFFVGRTISYLPNAKDHFHAAEMFFNVYEMEASAYFPDGSIFGPIDDEKIVAFIRQNIIVYDSIEEAIMSLGRIDEVLEEE